MSGLHKRKSLKSLLQDAKEKMTQAPEHIKAAQVLTEMQEDLREKISGENVRGECPESLSHSEKNETFESEEKDKFEKDVCEENSYITNDKEKHSKDNSDNSSDKCPVSLSGVNIRGKCPVSLSGDDDDQGTVTPQKKTKLPPSRRDVRELLPRRSRIVGERQRQLFYWLKDQGGSVRTTLPLITQLTGIEDRTLRRILTEWEKKGVLTKRSGQFGIELNLTCNERPAFPKKPLKSKKLRQTSSTALALNDICPTLVAAGFTEGHYLRIMETLEAQNIDTTQVWPGLRHAEWELANGKMTDRAGGCVSSPVDWVYKSLVSDGTYRIPKGYLSPIEKQRQLAEEEVSRERKALEELERLRTEKEALELQRQIDTLFEQVLADTESTLAQNILKPLPHFLRELGRENPLFQRACRLQVEDYLRNLVAAKNDRGK